MLTLDSFVRIPSGVHVRDLGDEAVLLQTDRGLYFGLDAVGLSMWNLLAEQGSLRSAHATLAAEYQVPPARLEQDLIAFVTDLADKGLVAIEPAR